MKFVARAQPAHSPAIGHHPTAHLGELRHHVTLEPRALPLHAQLGYASQGPKALGAKPPEAQGHRGILPRAPKALGALLLGLTAARVSPGARAPPFSTL